MSRNILDQATARAAKYCALRERAPLEIFEKLQKWGLSDEESNQVIDYLKKENYIDEFRFARAYCHDKFEFNKWGRIKIKMHISKYRLQEEAIAEGMNIIEEVQYQKMLLELAKKKIATTLDSNAYRKKQKVASYLVNKGFEMDLVFSTLKKMSFS